MRKFIALLASIVLCFGIFAACESDDGLQRFDDSRDILRFFDGGKVKNEKDWAVRREEILKVFRENVYGENIFSQLSVDFAVAEEEGYTGTIVYKEESIIRHRIRIIISDEKTGESVEADLYLYRDIETQNSPKPIVIHLNFTVGFVYSNLPDGIIENPSKKPTVPTSFAAEALIGAGFHVATLNVHQIAENLSSKNNLDTGVFKLVQPEKNTDAKTIGAWAWGASRAVDYFYDKEYIQKDKIAVAGHSRGGKAALWAGANDERISAVISNNSGCTGAAMSYNHSGETIKDINEKFPYWFCDKYREFNDMQNELPFDQHMLLATIAPRLLYVASSDKDANADPKNELWATRLAGDAYRLLGKKPLSGVSEENLELGKGYHDGDIAYHRKDGKHSMTYGDWLLFIDFFRAKGWATA